MNLVELTVEEIVERRNEVVRKYDEKKAPLRELRANGTGWTDEQWDLFDELNKQMNIELHAYDKALFEKGAMN